MVPTKVLPKLPGFSRELLLLCSLKLLLRWQTWERQASCKGKRSQIKASQLRSLCSCGLGGGVPPSLCLMRWVWDPTGLSGRDPVEVTVFCSEAGGEAEGKLKFVCCKAWVGWWEEWCAESSEVVFRGFNCTGKRAQNPEVTVKPQKLTSTWHTMPYRDSTTLVMCCGRWESGNRLCAWVGVVLGSCLFYTTMMIAWSPFCFPGSCITAAFPTHHQTVCIFKWGATSFFGNLWIPFEGEQQPFRQAAVESGHSEHMLLLANYLNVHCKINSLRWITTH